MRFVFLTTGLVASMIACPWFVAQEPTPGKSEKQVDTTSSPLQSGYTEGTRLGNRYSGDSATIRALPAEQMLLTPGQGNGAFNSSGMIAAWEMENGQWVLKSRPIGDLEVEAAIKKAYLAYQSAADDAARSKAAADLKANLEKQYDKFVEGQSKQIEEMEKRLAKLKEQLDKRRAAKERVVDLKLQMVLSQAEGLGFPESGLPNSATNYGDDQGRNPNAYRALVPPASLLPPQGLPFQSIPPAANPTPQVPMGDGEGQNQIE